jgi:hypothetical protein
VKPKANRIDQACRERRTLAFDPATWTVKPASPPEIEWKA